MSETATGAAENGGGAAPVENANGNGNGLYDQHLAETPEELRPYVTDAFKKWDSQVTPKLQEAAKLREQFGPLSEIEGLSDVPPDELAELVAFRQVLQDPEQLKDWLTQVNEAVGLNPGELSQEDWLSMGQQQGWLEDDGETPAAPSPQDIAQQVLDMLKPELEPVKQFMGRSEQEQATTKAKQEFANRMGELEGKHGELDDDARNAVYELAANYLDGEDPIGKAFERFLQITGRAEGERVDGQLRQPNGALNGGRPDTAPPKASWNGDGPNPRDIALARMKQG